ncbi:MAG: peptidoglycan glycosyltransferase, partial [Lachnospiraceae bacterium]|nr:peptidoglycan glycosyltransferase [Lachnospiraceae bacterium]
MDHKTYHRSKTVTVFFLCALVLLGLAGRLVYLMVFQSEYYTMKARQLHERERSIKAARGRIIDRNGKILADNKTVCTVSVIHSQITDADEVTAVLAKELGLSEEYVRKRVEKYSSIEKIKSNVDKATGDAIRARGLDGVKVDEDYKRYYPYDTLASKALGFTGGDNQGIIGLEVVYEEYLKGEAGTILTVTDATGVEQDEEGEERVEPVSGRDLYISLDINIQSYATQLAIQTMETKEADRVSILVMNPQNGEILAMADVPEFDLNNPYTLLDGMDAMAFSEKKRQELLNSMWRNGCIN